jgi:hypothetical protein
MPFDSPLFFLSLEKYAAFLGHLVTTASWHTSVYPLHDWLYLAVIGVVTFGLRERNWLYNEVPNRNLIIDSPVIVASLMFIGLLTISLSRTFIYFRF